MEILFVQIAVAVCTVHSVNDCHSSGFDLHLFFEGRMVLTSEMTPPGAETAVSDPIRNRLQAAEPLYEDVANLERVVKRSKKTA